MDNPPPHVDIMSLPPNSESGKQNNMYLSCKINNMDLMALVDTGAQLTDKSDCNG